MKLCVIGYGRHGKDTLCEILEPLLNLEWISSSYAAAEEIVFPVLKEKYNYETVQQCFEDRSNHRSEWYELIKAYNETDKARFSRWLMARYDIYCGLRNIEELNAAKKEGLFDLVIWVDASKRMSPEDKSSCTVTEEDADIIITNNGTEEEFALKVHRLARRSIQLKRKEEPPSMMDCIRD
ncbi:MAG: hypothetical protein F6K48_03295 [Okeania sp. SIO3H1]|nr:hypothetical protein [Okeania sp. SIO3H1]